MTYFQRFFSGQLMASLYGRGKQMARTGIAALHKLPGKSSLNINFVCPICSVCPDDHDDHGNYDEHDDHGNNDDQIGV